MTTQQTSAADAEGRAAYIDGQPYDSLPLRLRAGWKAEATERANAARRARLTANPQSREPWDKEPI